MCRPKVPSTRASRRSKSASRGRNAVARQTSTAVTSSDTICASTSAHTPVPAAAIASPATPYAAVLATSTAASTRKRIARCRSARGGFESPRTMKRKPSARSSGVTCGLSANAATRGASTHEAPARSTPPVVVSTSTVVAAGPTGSGCCTSADDRPESCISATKPTNAIASAIVPKSAGARRRASAIEMPKRTTVST